MVGGATAALIAGRKDLVHACYLQEMGIGRLMKAGKEGILELYQLLKIGCRETMKVYYKSRWRWLSGLNQE